MKVSAVIPTHNRRAHVQRAIESVLAQSVPVDEIVVVDDGSTDGTADEIQARFGSQVRLIRQANTGVSGARLRAIQEARGEWIAFLDSDDEWTPDRNRILTEMLSKVPESVAWIFGDLQIVTDRAAETTLFQKHGLKVCQSVEVFEDSLKIHHPFQFCMLQASLIRRDVLLECGCFTEGLRHSEDVLAGYQVATRYQFAATPSIVTRLYRTSDLSADSLMTDGRLRPDYYQARMLAFSLLVRSGRRQPWAELYANAVRGLCKYRAEDGLSIRKLAFQQFKHSYSLRTVSFLGLALFGSKVLRTLRLAYRKIRNDRDESQLQPTRLQE